MAEFVVAFFQFTMGLIFSMCLIMVTIIMAAIFFTSIIWGIKKACNILKKKEKKN